MKKVSIAVLISFALLFAACDNMFAPPTEVPPPPPAAQQAAAPAPTVAPSADRVYLVSSIQCDADRTAVHFTLYNPTEKTLSFETQSEPNAAALAVRMNGYPIRHLVTYCGQKTLEAGKSVDCVRSLQNDQDLVSWMNNYNVNAGSAQENSIDTQAPGYQTSVTFECGGNRPAFALTELGCSADAFHIGVRNVFSHPMSLGKASGNQSQYDFLHVQVNDESAETMDKDCGKDMLAPGETADCTITTVPIRSGTDDSGLPLSNQVIAKYQQYEAKTTLPCK